MTYGTIKVDTVTFTDAGIDKSVTLSGLVQNPTFSGNVTVTGTLSGVTVTGTTANFTSGNFTNISGGTHTITSGVFAAGSAASPSITFTGDLNTGIYSPGADQVAISTGGSGRLFVDASGRVGIGQAPSFGFDLQGTGQVVQRVQSTSASGLSLGSFLVAGGNGAVTYQVDVDGTGNNFGPGALIGTTTNHFTAFRTNNTERLRIDSSGRLLVGTSSGSGNNLLQIQGEAGSSAGIGGIVLRRGLAPSLLGSGSIMGRIDFGPNDGGIGASIVGEGDAQQGTNDYPSRLVFSTTADGASSPTERLRITSAGLVGIGTTGPTATVHANSGSASDVYFRSSNSLATSSLGTAADGSTYVYNSAAYPVTFSTNATERARIDSSGRLLVGTSTARSNYFNAVAPTTFQVEGTNYQNASASLTCNATELYNASVLVLARSGGTTVGSNTLVSNDQYLGAVSFQGNDGAEFVTSAEIRAEVDGTPGANDMPGRLVFSTTADGASSPTERLRITSAGLVGVGTSSPSGLLTLAWNSSTGINAGLIGQVNNSAGANNGYRIGLRTSSDATNWCSIDQAFSNLGVDASSYIAFTTTAGLTPAERMRLTSTGLGIGTTTPGYLLTASTSSTSTTLNDSAHWTVAVQNAAAATANQFNSLLFRFNDGIYNGNSIISALRESGTGRQQSLIFAPANSSGDPTERARIDSSGRLLVGTSTSLRGSKLEVLSTGNDHQSLIGGNQIAQFELCRSSSSAGGAGVVASGDVIARIECLGNDGSAYRSAARIEAAVDGTPGANDMPGRLVFSTTPDNTSSPLPRLYIKADGNITFGKDNSNYINAGAYISPTGIGVFTASTDRPLGVNRLTNDGNLVEFWQDSISEGSISVSGTTVSYNGAHLSRWSQLPSSQQRTEILRGSVLSNIDEMCEWGEEDNEQLNRMKVSDVEGDKNVSGVFQAWDDDDDTYTNDFYCAMTGDFIIRIAQGVTVERGDLLMSAGDGTAKPQDDDIIRSKTIAKVTSTNVSCTYDDGSYCVPCVLMAC